MEFSIPIFLARHFLFRPVDSYVFLFLPSKNLPHHADHKIKKEEEEEVGLRAPINIMLFLFIAFFICFVLRHELGLVDSPVPKPNDPSRPCLPQLVLSPSVPKTSDRSCRRLPT